MGTHGLPDMYTLGPWASGCTYQACQGVVHIGHTMPGMPDIRHAWHARIGHAMPGMHDICTPDVRPQPPWGPVTLGPQGVHIKQTTHAHATNTKYITLHGWIKEGQAEIQLKCIREKRDTTEMYPGKVMHMIGG